MKRIHRFTPLLVAAAMAACVVGCFSSPTSKPSSSSSSNSSNGSTKDTAANGKTGTADELVGDPSVPPEQEGPGFTGEGWETATPGPLGDPRAVKGGTLLTEIRAWPDNLRMYGIRSNTWLNYAIRDLCYESMLSINPNTLEHIPRLASHWQILDDHMRFRFRINPAATWSDGTPVTADDVIATYKLIMDDTLLAPMSKEALSKMHEPVKESKYIVEVKCKERDWRNFLSLAGLTLLPAHEIVGISGERYLDEYNFKYTAVTGPYVVHPEDIDTDKSITLTRRKDYWAINEPAHVGLYNIDRIRFVVVREDRLAFDMACKGELDFYNVNIAKWWVEDLPSLEAIDKGHLVRRKVYAKFPKGFQGHALNTRNPPLDDVRVRKALGHLYDRKTMIAKFAYNEYEPLRSYFPGSDSENYENQMVEYDPQQAADLLAEAGWTERGPDGILVKDGKRMNLSITYSNNTLEKYLTTWQEAAKKAGVELSLQEIDPETSWNNTQDRKFEIVGMGWGAILFPYPRTMWYSKMSELKGSNNITGFQSTEADRIIDLYDKEFDLAERTKLLRQLDAVIFNEHPYVLEWSLPCERIMYWNKFGMPDTVFHKYAEYEDAFATWWVDPDKERALKAARKSGAGLEIPELEVRPWDNKPAETAAAD